MLDMIIVGFCLFWLSFWLLFFVVKMAVDLYKLAQRGRVTAIALHSDKDSDGEIWLP